MENKIYTEFLFTDFLYVFSKSYFRVPKNQSKQKMSKMLRGARAVYYTWEDQNFRELMIKIVRVLEPRRLSAGTIIYRIV